MLELEFGGQRYPIPAGESFVGSEPTAALFLSEVQPRHVLIQGTPEGAASVRPGSPEAEVLLNGVKLGAEPAPILHGDKLQVGPHELLVTDPRRSGSTQFVSTSDVAKMAGQFKSGAPKPATAATGGRLVCLTDGREYTIGSAPMVFGREAGCDIVVPNKDVSRRHAEIMATPQGYVVVDSSTNGTFVNGERIEMQRVLARADVVRVGDHEFRFYADLVAEKPEEGRAPREAPPLPAAQAEPPVIARTPILPAPAQPPPPAASPAPAAAAPAPPPAPLPPAPAAVAPPAPAPVASPAPAPVAPPPAQALAPDSAMHRLSETMHGIPVTPMPNIPRAAPVPRTAPGSVLATFLVRSGSLKGNRLQVKVPVVNIGRAEYNDIVIPDESVSTMHAKLQRREEIWVLSDNGSTNGTFVDGERLSGEIVLSPGALIRFGETAVMFEPTDSGDVKKGSGTKIMGAIQVPAIQAPAAPPPVPQMAPERSAPAEPLVPASKPPLRRPVVVSSHRSSDFPGWLVPVAIVVILAAVAAFLLLK